ncbi:hypothetical protein VLK31_35365 [Variovorax sp. H27-G14]|uniref:hypothetical protein n=1 Tax=Variovorax sp. H27-G14 TaxID=3111914 RepID=UPI0038FCCAB7
MNSPSLFEKELALRAAGFHLIPYPTHGPATARPTQIESDWALLEAGTAWEEEIHRLYAELIASDQGRHLDLRA